MRGRRSRRNIVLSAAIAAAAYFTACPPYALSPLAPGRPAAPRRTAAGSGRDAPASGDLRDALNAGSPAPPARAPASRVDSDFARGLNASALGMTGGDGPRAPSSAGRTIPPEPSRAASSPAPRKDVGDAPEDRPRARPAFIVGARSAAGADARRDASARDDDFQSAERLLEASRPARDAARRARWSEDEAADGAVDLRRGRGRRASSLFEPTRQPRPEARRTAPRTPRFRPPRLSQLLGGKALRPPPSSLRAPVGLAGLALKRPYSDARGRIVPPPSRELEAIEAVAPDKLAADRRQDAHWDGETWHERRAHGFARGGGWLWLLKDGQRWWGLVGRTPLVRHQNLWWLRKSDVWLVLHEGEPWAWRHFQDWDEAEGLFHPATGTEIVYSPDLSRAAVITPGEGAVVYDALSGAEIGRIPEGAMPARRRPKAPKPLSLP